MASSRRTGVRVLLIVLSAVSFGQGAFAAAAADPKPLEIDDYEQEVSAMIATSDQIIADYGDGDQVATRVDALVDTWENVDFHEAVETHAMTLYPPIWIALGGLRETVDKPGAIDDSRKWQARLQAALHEGLGALKLVAAMPAQTEAAQTLAAEQDDRPTITIIQDNLDQVLVHYRDGDIAQARTLIHQTYMQRFEGVEGDLIEQDADLVTDLEKDFNATLPLLLEKKASADKVGAQIERMNTKLDRAQALMNQADSDRGSVF